jgi:hypothetical protein
LCVTHLPENQRSEVEELQHDNVLLVMMIKAMEQDLKTRKAEKKKCRRSIWRSLETRIGGN